MSIHHQFNGSIFRCTFLLFSCFLALFLWELKETKQKNYEENRKFTDLKNCPEIKAMGARYFDSTNALVLRNNLEQFLSELVFNLASAAHHNKRTSLSV